MLIDGGPPSTVDGRLGSAGPLLQVRGLTVAFRSGGAWRDVVEDLSFDLAPTQTLAVVGESGSGKSVTALSIMRLLPPLYARCSGEIRFDGRDLLTASRDEMRSIRGDRIAMIFHEPMTSLNPVFTVGFQIAEALKYHRGMERAAARRPAIELLDHVRIPNARERFDSFPHTLYAPARHDRHGARLRAEAAHCRRAHDCPRCDRPATDPRSHQIAAERDGHVGAVHYPRYGRGCRHRRSRAGDARRRQAGGRDVTAGFL